MIALVIRDRKGRDVATKHLYDHQFRVETTPLLAVVLYGVVDVPVTHKGRGPFTWHLGELSGPSSIEGAALRPGGYVRFTDWHIYLHGESS